VQRRGEAVHRYPSGDHAVQPAEAGFGQGVGGLLVMAAADVDRVEQTVTCRPIACWFPGQGSAEASGLETSGDAVSLRGRGLWRRSLGPERLNAQHFDATPVPKACHGIHSGTSQAVEAASTLVIVTTSSLAATGSGR
jgi:hypothetical protein